MTGYWFNVILFRVFFPTVLAGCKLTMLTESLINLNSEREKERNELTPIRSNGLRSYEKKSTIFIIRTKIEIGAMLDDITPSEWFLRRINDLRSCEPLALCKCMFLYHRKSELFFLLASRTEIETRYRFCNIESALLQSKMFILIYYRSCIRVDNSVFIRSLVETVVTFLTGVPKCCLKLDDLSFRFPIVRRRCHKAPRCPFLYKYSLL